MAGALVSHSDLCRDWCCAQSSVSLTIESKREGLIYEFEIPHAYVGRLIGKCGKFVKSIRMATGANVMVMDHPFCTSMNICVVEGTWRSEIDEALTMIRERFPLSKFANFTFDQICCYYDQLVPTSVTPSSVSFTSVWSFQGNDDSKDDDDDTWNLLDQLTELKFPSLADSEGEVEGTNFGDPMSQSLSFSSSSSPDCQTSCDCFHPLTEGFSLDDKDQETTDCQIWIPGLTHDLDFSGYKKDEEILAKIKNDIFSDDDFKRMTTTTDLNTTDKTDLLSILKFEPDQQVAAEMGSNDDTVE